MPWWVGCSTFGSNVVVTLWCLRIASGAVVVVDEWLVQTAVTHAVLTTRGSLGIVIVARSGRGTSEGLSSNQGRGCCEVGWCCRTPSKTSSRVFSRLMTRTSPQRCCQWSQSRGQMIVVDGLKRRVTPPPRRTLPRSNPAAATKRGRLACRRW